MVMSVITEDDSILRPHGSPLSKTPVTYTYDFIELTIHHYPSRLFTVLKTDYTFNQFQPICLSWLMKGSSTLLYSFGSDVIKSTHNLKNEVVQDLFVSEVRSV